MKRTTVVIVDGVIADHLELQGAVLPIPPHLALATPRALVVGEAGPVASVGAVVGATRDGAVAAIVAGHAHAGAVLALAMHIAPVKR